MGRGTQGYRTRRKGCDYLRHDGYVYDPAGLDADKINYMLELRASGNDVVAPYAERYAGSTFFAGRKPWEQKVDIALPCATQNELNGDDAHALIANGVEMVAEVSNMGCTPEAIDAFIESRTVYAPGKAVNAGGVATSGLEMSQNAMHLQWTAEEVDQKLHVIMTDIHSQCLKYGVEPDGYINYMKGANIMRLHEGCQRHDGSRRLLIVNIKHQYPKKAARKGGFFSS